MKLAEGADRSIKGKVRHEEEGGNTLWCIRGEEQQCGCLSWRKTEWGKWLVEACVTETNSEMENSKIILWYEK